MGVRRGGGRSAARDWETPRAPTPIKHRREKRMKEMIYYSSPRPSRTTPTMTLTCWWASGPPEQAWALSPSSSTSEWTKKQSSLLQSRGINGDFFPSVQIIGFPNAKMLSQAIICILMNHVFLSNIRTLCPNSPLNACRFQDLPFKKSATVLVFLEEKADIGKLAKISREEKYQLRVRKHIRTISRDFFIPSKFT